MGELDPPDPAQDPPKIPGQGGEGKEEPELVRTALAAPENLLWERDKNSPESWKI